jgi:hypothetical protein
MGLAHAPQAERFALRVPRSLWLIPSPLEDGPRWWLRLTVGAQQVTWLPLRVRPGVQNLVRYLPDTAQAQIFQQRQRWLIELAW